MFQHKHLVQFCQASTWQGICDETSKAAVLQEIEATLLRSARSTDGLIETARILSTLKRASDQAQSTSHPTNAAFADRIAQKAEARVHDSSERQQQHTDASSGSDQANSGITHCNSLFMHTDVHVKAVGQCQKTHVNSGRCNQSA